MPFVEGDVVDIAFTAEVNSFRSRSVQLVLRDMRLCETERRRDDAELCVYRTFCGGGLLSASQYADLRPSREELVAVWRHVRSRAVDGVLNEAPSALCRKINHESKKQLSIGKLLVCLDVFHEFKLFEFGCMDGLLHIRVNQASEKADINGSQILARLRHAAP